MPQRVEQLLLPLRPRPAEQLELFGLPQSRADLLNILAEHANDERECVPSPELIEETPLRYAPILAEDVLGLEDIRSMAAPFLDHTGAVLPNKLDPLRLKLALFSQGKLIVFEHTDGTIEVDRLMPVRLPVETSIDEEKALVARLMETFRCNCDELCVPSTRIDRLQTLLDSLFPNRFRVILAGSVEFQIQDKGLTDLPSSFSQRGDED
ncbi:hypothetical protein IPJ72_06375 [Candidatus Peregrinibacteria bacterium]|nr:MAG: hypothetical protein IPJ72_06375 [Candidatus Peregrinibacteria bacterium]